MNDIISYATLSNGVRMPWLGFGVYKIKEGTEAIKSVKHALKAGYRSIDTAALYANEQSVGTAVKESGISREEVFITTKVWNEDQGYESTLKAYEESRRKLGLDYIDLYLIHWAVAGKYLDTWRALEKLYKDGYVRAIGVCNFQIHHLEKLMAQYEIAPMVNQVECHPLLSQNELLSYCMNKGIQLEAWGPVIRGHLDIPLLDELNEKYSKTAAQIVLRWNLQRGVVIIPKSVNPKRIEENSDIFNFKLEDEDIKLINNLNQNKRLGPDPDIF